MLSATSYDDEFVVPREFARHSIETVATPVIPEPYRCLLVHFNSMTATLSHYYRTNVQLIVLHAQRRDDVVDREVILSCTKGRTLAMACIRIYLKRLSHQVAAEVMASREPFGSILERYQLGCRFSPVSWLRVPATSIASADLCTKPTQYRYGRKSRVLDNQGRPLASVVEILMPADDTFV